MALVQTNQSFYTGTPGNSNINIPHLQASGAGGFLMVLVMFRLKNNALPVPSYGGTPLVEFFQYNNNNFRIGVYGLLNPTPGTSNVSLVVSQQNNPASVIATSFTGSIGFGVRNQNLSTSSNNTTTLNGVTAGSMIQGYGMGTSSSNNANIQVPAGTVLPTREWRHNVNAWFWGNTSGVLTAGNITVRSYGGQNWMSTRTGGVEIKESGAAPVSRRRIIIT